MSALHFPSRHTRREYRLPPYDCGQGYRPADEHDRSAERETAFENGFMAGMATGSFIAAALVMLLIWSLK